MTKIENTTISYWSLKSVSHEDLKYKSIDGYKDEIETKYVYDNSVPNHKQIKSGDVAVLIDKENVLGLAKISQIVIFNGKKTRRRCPECGSTSYEPRKTKTPKYRCACKYEFDEPKEEKIDVTNFEAYYSTSFIVPQKLLTIDVLKPFYPRGYNSNNSMQSMSEDFFTKYYKAEVEKLNKEFIYPSAEEALNYLSDSYEDDYIPSEKDERPKIIQSIYARRGQKMFRDSLRKLYGDKCMITGCEVLDVIEAAHINPYKGKKDNHVTNGLLLRSDIHTLFDLNLIGINPKTSRVEICKSLFKTEYEELNNVILSFEKGKRPSEAALGIRWNLFRR
jgi:putative restriction endonuclease